MQVEELTRRKDGLLVVDATIFVESESQKGIIVGKGGRMIKSVGVAARKEIERLTGERCHLDLTASVKRDWRGDERVLDSLGID